MPRAILGRGSEMWRETERTGHLGEVAVEACFRRSAVSGKCPMPGYDSLVVGGEKRMMTMPDPPSAKLSPHSAPGCSDDAHLQSSAGRLDELLKGSDMSGIQLSGNRLTQRIRGCQEEFGYIEFKPSSDTCVLWLKDTFGVANTAGAYIRADEYPSLEVAKSKVLSAPSVFIWHLIWMRGVLKREAEKELEDHWEQLSANDAVPSKQSLKDRLRAHLDRLPSDKVKKLFGKIGTVALTQAIAEIIKRFLNGE